MGPYAEARDAEKQGKHRVLELFGVSERAILGPIWGSFWDPFRLKMGAFGAHLRELGEIDLALHRRLGTGVRPETG